MRIPESFALSQCGREEPLAAPREWFRGEWIVQEAMADALDTPLPPARPVPRYPPPLPPGPPPQPQRQEAVDPVGVVDAIPRAYDMACLLGDRKPFELKEPWVKSNRQSGGTTWVSDFFKSITRGDVTWSWPNVDAHITLIYIKLQPLEIEERLRRLETAIAKTQPMRWLAAGLFNEKFAVENYAWIDLLVNTPVHSTLHSMAAIMHGGRLTWGTKASFHLSFRSWASDA